MSLLGSRPRTLLREFLWLVWVHDFSAPLPCEKLKPLRFKIIFSMTYVTQSTNPSTMCTNTLKTKNCNYLTTFGLPVFSRNPWLHSVSQHFCSAHTVQDLSDFLVPALSSANFLRLLSQQVKTKQESGRNASIPTRFRWPFNSPEATRENHKNLITRG